MGVFLWFSYGLGYPRLQRLSKGHRGTVPPGHQRRPLAAHPAERPGEPITQGALRLRHVLSPGSRGPGIERQSENTKFICTSWLFLVGQNQVY